ncbi:MAG: RNA methyltransferase [Rikenellaceae bacterium]|jgi:tRNA G18 (ribose-2'-O)-methylase SpoU|nr:RNA methyltransferase [Rikenellaceae bacterium]
MQKTTYDIMGRPTAEQFARQQKIPVTVVLDNVRSANNVGSFFRTCDAFAAERLVLCGITAVPPSKDIHKTALGAEQTVAWEYFPTTAQALTALEADGYIIVAVEQVDGAIELQSFIPHPDAKYALVFGNEVDGVGQAALDECDSAIEIPQVGTKHSLNVAVSGGAVLWHFFAHYGYTKP